MSSIDSRVVEMKFDNAAFERGLQTTLKSLGLLQQGLKLDGATKGLDHLSATASKFSLGNLANDVSSIASKFSAMGIIGVTALANIANRAVSAGLAMAKSLTIDPVKSGLQEYETNLNSIQTILANTGLEGKAGLSKVTASLDELNHYSDNTIYNFSEMARNIGTFTAAGVKLGPATAAIKGIANLAAVSGSNSEQASTAMYQLSQAMAAGKATLIDWNSVVNAGMGGKVFQEALKETARVQGVNVDKIIKKNGSFRDSLKDGWLTTKVLTETLSKFTGDLTADQLKSMGYTKAQIAAIQKMGKTAQDAATKVKTVSQLIGTLREAMGSGWAKTWQLLFGNFDEAKTMFTNVSNVLGGFIQHSADARNKVIGDWKALGGRTVLIQAISNAFNALISVLKPIKAAFREIFPAATGKDLFALTKTLAAFTANLKIGGTTANNLKRTFAGVFAIFSIGISILKGIGTAIARAFSSSGGSGGILEFTGNIGDWLVALDKAIKSGKGFHDFFVKLGNVLAWPIKSLRFLVGILSEVMGGVNDVAAAGNAKLSQSIDKWAKKFSNIGGILKSVWGFLVSLTGKFGEFFSSITDGISSSADKVDYAGLLSTINTGLLGGLVLMFKKFLSNGIDLSVFGGLKDALSGLTGVLGAMQTNLKANALLKIAAAIAILALAVGLMSMIDPKRLGTAMAGLALMFYQMVGAMKLLDAATSTRGFIKMPFVTVAFIALAVAIDLLALAVAKLATLDWNGLAKGLTGVATLLVSLALFTKFSNATKIGSGVSLILLAFAIKLLVDSVKDISGMNWGEIAKGLTGVAVLLGALALFSKFTAANAGGIAQGAGILLIAVAIKILASAIGDIAKMSWQDLGKGLAVMAVGLGLIAAALALVPATSLLSAAAIVLVALSFTRIALAVGIVVEALNKLADVIKKMGQMSWTEVAKGLIVMAVSVGLIAAALILIPKTALLSAGAIFVVALALGKIADALGKMGGMSWEEIAKSLITLAAALIIIIAAMVIMPSALPGAAALWLISSALQGLVPVLVAFAGLGWGGMAVALVTLAGLFAVLGLAGLVLAPVVPVISALSNAIFLLGLGMLAAGAGMLLFSAGLAALAVSGAAGVAIYIGAIKQFALLIPFLATQLGLGVIAFAKVIATAGPAFTQAIVAVLNSVLDAINKLSPKIVDTLLRMLLMLLDTLNKYMPRLIDAGTKLITSILQGIANHIDGIVTAATNLIVNFINALAKNLPRVQQAGADLIVKYVNGLATAIRNNSKAMGEAGGNLASAIIEGMVTGLASGAGKVASEAAKVAKGAWEAAKNFLQINSPSKKFAELGMGADEGMANGLVDYAHLVGKSAEGVGQTAIDSLSKSIAGIASVLTTDADFNPVIRPVLDLTDVQKNAAQIGSMLSTTPIAVSATISSAKDASAGYNANQVVQGPADANTAPGDISYTQNNYSPKALSAATIYRNTKNQLSVAKGALTP